MDSTAISRPVPQSAATKGMYMTCTALQVDPTFLHLLEQRYWGSSIQVQYMDT